jgi:hypothetical protein
VSARVLLRPRANRRAGSEILFLGLIIIALGLLFRILALAGSWFYFDDLAFMSAGTNDPLTWSFIGRVYAGHLMPAGWLVIKALATWAPYQWGVWAGLLVLMQAVASWGMLRLLRSMFGDTRAVLGLLAGYVFYVFTLPAGLWFAAGINQLPLQIGLAFGLHAHLDYLRTRRTRSLILTLAWTMGSLAFYEKSVILFGLYALVALCWFSHGRIGDRVREVWDGYRAGVVALGSACVLYLGVYAQVGLSVGSHQPGTSLLGSVAYRLIAQAFSTATIGGPFEWRPISANALADPSDLMSLVSWVVVGSVIWYAASTRTMSRRAWSLIAFTLLADTYLLASARANLVGPDIGLEYRYQSESAAVFVLSLGLAFLPLQGAKETNAVREGAPRGDERPPILALITVSIVLAALISSLGYVRNWQHANPTRPYFDNVRRTLRDISPKPVPLVDGSVPLNLLWAFGFPENTYSHVFKSLNGRVAYPDHSVDALYVLDDTGRAVPAEIPPTRTMAGGSGCGYVLDGSTTTIPLNGPVIGGGWWVALDYGAPQAFPLRISRGDQSTMVPLPAGDHRVYFRADGSYDSLVLTYPPEARSTCVTGVTLGLPQPGPPT